MKPQQGDAFCGRCRASLNVPSYIKGKVIKEEIYIKPKLPLILKKIIYNYKSSFVNNSYQFPTKFNNFQRGWNNLDYKYILTTILKYFFQFSVYAAQLFGFLCVCFVCYMIASVAIYMSADLLGLKSYLSKDLFDNSPSSIILALCTPFIAYFSLKKICNIYEKDKEEKEKKEEKILERKKIEEDACRQRASQEEQARRQRASQEEQARRQRAAEEAKRAAIDEYNRKWSEEQVAKNAAYRAEQEKREHDRQEQFNPNKKIDPDKVGYVYILKMGNGVYKIGHTRRTPQQRAKEWKSDLLAYAKTEDSAASERAIHAYLSKYRCGTYEIFQVDFKIALKAVERIAGPIEYSKRGWVK